MEFLFEYGIFFAKTITLIVGILVVVIVIVGLGHKTRSSERGHIQVTNINENFENITNTLKQVVMNAESLKAEHKAEKKRQKLSEKENGHSGYL